MVNAVYENDLPPTPDFDSYPISATILSATLEAEGRGLKVAWSDGRTSRYHAIWLRDNASDGDVLNLETREPWSDVTALPADTRIATADIDAVGALSIRWASGETISRFHPGWLHAHGCSNPDGSNANGSNPGPRDPAKLAPVLWDRETLPEPPTFDGAAILEDDTLLESWLQAVATYGIARLRNVRPEAGMVTQVAERLGPVRPTNFGDLFDVRVKKGPGSNAYTAVALTPHSDLPTREYQPGLQFLHCLQASGHGGTAIMVDGYRLAAQIRAQDPDAYRALTEIPWPLSNRALDTDYRWQSPVICLNQAGMVEELRVAPFLRAPLTAAYDQVERAYRSLRVFFEATADTALQLRFAYKPGDLIAMDNRRLLHGRDAYDPNDGERWLQGCYGERDELFSRLRILARRHPRSD